MTLEDVISGDSEVVEEYENAEMKEQLIEVLKQLPERERFVITLYYYEELSPLKKSASRSA